MLNELKTQHKTIGLKQTLRALREGKAIKVFLAKDADDNFKNKVLTACREANVSVFTEATMLELGEACEISIGAAACAIVNE